MEPVGSMKEPAAIEESGCHGTQLSTGGLGDLGDYSPLVCQYSTTVEHTQVLQAFCRATLLKLLCQYWYSAVQLQCQALHCADISLCPVGLTEIIL